MSIASQALALRSSRKISAVRTYYPLGTMKCDGVSLFRSQVARDLACLFDFNPGIVSWRCMPISLDCGRKQHVPDFEVLNSDGTSLFIDAPDRNVDIAPIKASASEKLSMGYRQARADEMYDGPRLKNAKDLLRYANYNVSLGDRLRLLSALDEHGTLTVAESLTAFSETKPVAGLAVMILHGFIEIDLDASLIGPETTVRRIGV